MSQGVTSASNKEEKKMTSVPSPRRADLYVSDSGNNQVEAATNNVDEKKPDLADGFLDHLDSTQCIERFKKYEAEYTRRLLAKYFSAKSLYGGDMSSNKALFKKLKEKTARGGSATARGGSFTRSTPLRDSPEIVSSGSSPQPVLVDLTTLTKIPENRPMEQLQRESSGKRTKLSSMTADPTLTPTLPEIWTNNLAADHEGLIALGSPGDHSYIRDLSPAAREQLSLDCGLWIYKVGTFYMSTVEENKSLRAEVERYQKSESDVEASNKYLSEQEAHLRDMENEVIDKKGKLENALNSIKEHNSTIETLELKAKSWSETETKWSEEKNELVAEVAQWKGKSELDAAALENLKKEHAEFLEGAQGLVQSQFDNALAQIKLQFPDLEIDHNKLFPTGRVEGNKIVDEADDEVYLSFSPNGEVHNIPTSGVDPQTSTPQVTISVATPEA